MLPLVYTSWVLETLSDDPGLIATYMVLVVSISVPAVLRPATFVVISAGAGSQGGIEHTVCSCMVLVSLCMIICPCCQDVEHTLKVV